MRTTVSDSSRFGLTKSNVCTHTSGLFETGQAGADLPQKDAVSELHAPLGSSQECSCIGAGGRRARTCGYRRADPMRIYLVALAWSMWAT